MTSTPEPTAERIRLTITVTPEVHAVFTRMAEASNVSLGRAMGDWLAETSEAADMMAKLMSEARAAPKQVMRQLQGMALGLVDMTEETLENMRAGKGKPSARVAGAVPVAGAGAGAARATTAPAPSPRLVIRGVKSPKAGRKEGRT